MPMDSEGCCVPESEVLKVRDLNMAVSFKGGNQYARICPECGTKKFCTKRYWQTAEQKHVIPEDDDLPSEPVPIYDCPYDCDDYVHEYMDECSGLTPSDSGCGGELEWVDEEADDSSQGDDEQETEDNHAHA